MQQEFATGKKKFLKQIPVLRFQPTKKELFPKFEKKQ
jgi:hypothetical protein